MLVTTDNQEPILPSVARNPCEVGNQELPRQNEVLVRVNGVSKKFCRDLKKSLWYGIKDVATELMPFGKQKSEIRDRRSDSSSLTSDLRPPISDPGLRPGEFWANKDISFELRRGECLGLIGRNGAGKTTLLKMLNGLIKPDEGTIEMRGRVGALIALGAGFNPILSGRENVYVNGSILGLAKEEIDSKIEDIIDFAEIRDFIDAPVQSYSSGMQVRLGFAVATALEPDILILDEVLAVGDLAFRMKCYNRIDKLRQTAAVIFVSHSMEHIGRICNSTLLLKNGQLIHYGDVAVGLVEYEKNNQAADRENSEFCNEKIESVTTKIEKSEIENNESQSINVSIIVKQSIQINCRITIFDINTSDVVGTAETRLSRPEGLHIAPEAASFQLTINHLYLRPGKYEFVLSLFDHMTNELIYAKRGGHDFDIAGSYYSERSFLAPLQLEIL